MAPPNSGNMPPSSPRLPSPPPFPEVQTAPKSPAFNNHDMPLVKSPKTKRVRPGTKAAEMAKGPSLVPLSELNSPFQLQEYLKALHHRESHDEEGNTKAINRAAAVRLATPPEGVERSLWLYELCRLLIARVNILIVGFFNDNPKCSAANCPEMRASEWQYLCAVHDPPKSCCAIDYCCHTLDWATNIITSQKHFPSRLTLGGDGGASQQGIRQLTNIFRRVYRMFAHAWFQHRDVFWQVENTEGLYAFYKTVCEVYSLMPSDTYTVPLEAEVIASAESATVTNEAVGLEELVIHQIQQDLPLRPKVAREGTVINVKETPVPSMSGLNTSASTKRHKQTPSTGSFVLPITEDDEDAETTNDGEDDQSDAASMLSTVRYDPGAVQVFASREDANDEDSTMENVPETPRENKSVIPDDSSVGGESHKSSSTDGKSPITPIDDEPSYEQQEGINDRSTVVDVEAEVKAVEEPDGDETEDTPLSKVDDEKDKTPSEREIDA